MKVEKCSTPQAETPKEPSLSYVDILEQEGVYEPSPQYSDKLLIVIHGNTGVRVVLVYSPDEGRLGTPVNVAGWRERTFRRLNVQVCFELRAA